MACAVVGWTASSPAAAQSVADFYRGKTINLLVGSGEGGGFDLSARLTAQFLSRAIPGSPTIVVQNMPGASGLRVAEFVYNVAPRDGTVIAITQPSIVQHKVLNASARFNPAEYTWIGRLGAFVTTAWCGTPRRRRRSMRPSSGSWSWALWDRPVRARCFPRRSIGLPAQGSRS
jgi:tripartite-type tricarboxylate transporter receptor subunit TctC